MTASKREVVPPEREAFVSPEEVMRVLDISRRQYERLVRAEDGPIPFHTIGTGRNAKRRFLLSEVHLWRTRRKRAETEGG